MRVVETTGLGNPVVKFNLFQGISKCLAKLGI